MRRADRVGRHLSGRVRADLPRLAREGRLNKRFFCLVAVPMGNNARHGHEEPAERSRSSSCSRATTGSIISPTARGSTDRRVTAWWRRADPARPRISSSGVALRVRSRGGTAASLAHDARGTPSTASSIRSSRSTKSSPCATSAGCSSTTSRSGPRHLERMRNLGRHGGNPAASHDHGRHLPSGARRSRVQHAGFQADSGQRRHLGTRHRCLRGQPVPAVHDARLRGDRPDGGRRGRESAPRHARGSARSRIRAAARIRSSRRTTSGRFSPGSSRTSWSSIATI